MKTTTLIAALCCLLITATSAVGQDANGAERPDAPQQRSSDGETRLLQHLLKMNDQELVNLRQTIERIEKMPPEEKAQLRERIGKFHKMPPEKIDAMRKKYETIPKEQRNAMRERWMKMSPEERTEWRKKLKEMSREERKAIFEEQGFMAPPPHKGNKGPHTKRPDGKRPQPGSDSKPDTEPEEQEI